MWVSVLGLGFRLRPATRGWGVGVCVCSCARSACTRPFLAGICRACVSVFGLGFWLRPATPGWGIGGCVCLCACPAPTPPLLAGVCSVGVCALAWVLAAPRHSWLGCWGVCVFVCPLRLYPATPGRSVWCGCVCLGSGFGCAPPLLARVLGCVRVRVRTPLVPRHSWLGCAAWVCALGLGFRLRPASPGWGVGVCACLCSRSACTPPLLAGVCGVGVCVWARVSAAPRLSLLGCWGVCVFVCPLRLYPATPGRSVWCGCVCFGLGFGCAPLLLAGVLGCVCARARAPLIPGPTWLGCAAWVCVLGLGFRLRPASPGWGVGVCACLCSRSSCTPPLLAGVCGVGVCVWARFSAAPRHSWLGCWGVCVCSCAPSACTPPLLAGVCGVGVCAWAWVSAAPRHSWLGCSGVCVLVCPLRLFPATPGSGVWCWCVCLGSAFSCAPPFLAGLLGCVCVRMPAPLVPRNSWLGCARWVCVLWLGFWLRPATPGWGVGVCACSCARSACTLPLLAGVCGVGVCVWVRVSAAPRHSWLGCWGVCVFVCALRLYPATRGWGVRRGCVFGLGFWLRPATPGWGVGVCVCWCARSACTLPLVAGVCGVGVRLGGVLVAPRHSWQGCGGVCVFVCPLRLYPAPPGWGVRRGYVCFCSVFGCAPPLLAGVLGCVYFRVTAPLVPLPLLAWVCGVCVCVRARVSAAPRPAGVLGCVCVRVPAPLVPRHSWLGCAVWLCVLGLDFWLRPATLGWGVGVCVRLCARSGCTPPLLAGLCGVGVCVSARVSAAPRRSWLGCWRVCVCVCPLCLYPATPGWTGRCGCVCLDSAFGCARPLLAGVLGCVCVRVRTPLVPRRSWLGCVVWVCVPGLGFRLRPATPGWGLRVCAWSCACSACTPPLLAGVCDVGVCAWARVSAAARHSWLGRWGVCVFVCALRLYPAIPSWDLWCVCFCVWARVLAAPRHSWLGD